MSVDFVCVHVSGVYVNMLVCVCSCVQDACEGRGQWWGLPQLLSTSFFFEAESLTEVSSLARLTF